MNTMKKLSLTISFILLGLIGFLQAQISIDQSDMPQNGDTIRTSITFNILQIDPVPTGENYNWDFSDIIPMEQRVDSFLNMSDVSIVYQLFFAGAANQVRTSGRGVLPSGDEQNAYTFIDNNTNSYSVVGVGADYNEIPIPLKFDGEDVLFEFPLNYPDESSSYTSYDIDIPGVGYAEGWKDRTNIVDGWGSLTTPYGTFDVLRQRSEIIQYDSVYLDSLGYGIPINREYTEYRWIAQDKGIPVLFVSDDFLGPQISYIDSARLITGETILYADQVPSIYPNPASQKFTINNAGVYNRMEIFDINGRKQYSSLLNTGKQHFYTGESGLIPGIYLVRFYGKDIASTQKLIIR